MNTTRHTDLRNALTQCTRVDADLLRLTYTSRADNASRSIDWLTIDDANARATALRARAYIVTITPMF